LDQFDHGTILHRAVKTVTAICMARGPCLIDQNQNGICITIIAEFNQFLRVT
jgi:hypothetical protein